MGHTFSGSSQLLVLKLAKLNVVARVFEPIRWKMKHLEVLLNVPSMVVWIGLLFRLTIVHIRVELVKVYSRLISVLRTMATEKYDAGMFHTHVHFGLHETVIGFYFVSCYIFDTVSQQRIMEESIKREMNVKRDESKFTINPNTCMSHSNNHEFLHLVTKIHHVAGVAIFIFYSQ